MNKNTLLSVDSSGRVDVCLCAGQGDTGRVDVCLCAGQGDTGGKRQR